MVKGHIRINVSFPHPNPPEFDSAKDGGIDTNFRPISDSCQKHLQRQEVHHIIMYQCDGSRLPDEMQATDITRNKSFSRHNQKPSKAFEDFIQCRLLKKLNTQLHGHVVSMKRDLIEPHMDTNEIQHLKIVG